MGKKRQLFAEKVKLENWCIENDEEYAYAIGQFINYLQLKRGQKTHNMKNLTGRVLQEIVHFPPGEKPYNERLKEKLTNFYANNLAYIDTTNTKLRKCITNIMEYKPEGDMRDRSIEFTIGFSDDHCFGLK